MLKCVSRKLKLKLYKVLKTVIARFPYMIAQKEFKQHFHFLMMYRYLYNVYDKVCMPNFNAINVQF